MEEEDKMICNHCIEIQENVLLYLYEARFGGV